MSSDGKKVMDILGKSRPLLSGHFLLTSGLHSNRYVQCALVLQYPNYAAFLASEIAKKFGNKKIDAVVSPAIGGIVIGQEVARVLKARSLFAERDEGRLTLRRGFELRNGERVLVVEDVLTTGGSVKEIIKIVRKSGAKLAGVGSIVNRSIKSLNFNAPVHSVVKLKIKTFDSQNCPLCKQGIPVVKPGSRKLK